MDQPWTEDSVTRTLINPNYCLTDPPVVTEEKWIDANAKLVQKMGAYPRHDRKVTRRTAFT